MDNSEVAEDFLEIFINKVLYVEAQGSEPKHVTYGDAVPSELFVDWLCYFGKANLQLNHKLH
jgi:hypothetical protein